MHGLTESDLLRWLMHVLPSSCQNRRGFRRYTGAAVLACLSWIAGTALGAMLGGENHTSRIGH